MALFSKIKNKLFGQKITKYDQGLKKSRLLFVSKIQKLAARYRKIDEKYFEDLEELLINYDVGYQMATKIIDEIRIEVLAQKLSDPQMINDIIIDKMFVIYTDSDVLSTRLNFHKSPPTIMVFIGINGNGKTTTIGKLAYNLTNMGKKVLVIAGDTFRAGAKEQLLIWSQRAQVDYFAGQEQQKDPSSVIFQGLEKATRENYDVVLVDTAGRLENKVNLMAELQKMNKVIRQQIHRDADEVLLVLDATTGQNGVIQAKAFANIMPITGIVLTKMDGSSRGGIVLNIKEDLNIPVKLIGFGEKINDLEEFDLDKYIYGLTNELFETHTYGVKHES